MKTSLLILGLGLLNATLLRAQDFGILRIKGGPNWQQSVPIRDRYRYEQFRQGIIAYGNGQRATGQLNYNILIGEMQFIVPNGDTLAVDNESTIRAIQIGENSFRYDPKYGFMEIRADFQPILLVFKPIFKTIRAEKNGGYNQSSGTSSISQYKSFIGSSGQLSRLEQEGDLLLEKDMLYGMIDQNNRFHKLTRSTVLKVFAKHKPLIETYLKTEMIDFKKEGDLKKLLHFCSTLS
ncbi:hypothetical protein ACFPMF_16750 [Larkinella bovis]|uniref:DUF4369 domain-containing protein n=1 Tax=Larkinella bovis TaxID=683041 RepID=A0ABW0IEZ2_9BACT